MERIWRGLGLGLGKYWWAVLGGVVVITGVLVIGATRIEFATGQDSYLNSESQEAIDNVAFQDQFGGEAVILLFTAEGDAIIPDLFSDANRAELTRLEGELRAIPEVFAVITPLTSTTFSSSIITEGVGTDGLTHAAEDDPDEASAALRNDDLTTTLFRRNAIEEANRTLANREWLEFLLYDNTGFVRDGTDVSGPPAAERSIRLSLRSTYPDQQTAVGGVIIEGNADLDTLSSGTEQVLEIMATAQLDGWTVTTTGSPVFLKDINDYLQGGMLTLGAAAVALMAVVLLVAFPVRWRLLPLLAVLIAVGWTFSLLGFIGIDLSLVTISGLPILIGLGVDFAIQIHNRVEEEVVLDREDHPMRETLANLGPPLVAATFAAVAAFLILQVSLVPMIRDFGVMLAVGIVIILLVGVVVPTAILGIREYRARTQSVTELTRIERGIVSLGRLPQKAVVPIIVLAVGVLVAGILLEDQFEIESDPVKWVNQDTQTVRDIDRLRDETGFESTLGVLIQANNVNAEPVATMLHEFLLEAEARDAVANSSSMVSTMSKIINGNPDHNPVPPRPEDLEALIGVMPADIERLLVNPDRTAAQVNLRLAPAPLEEDAILVDALRTDLERRIATLELPADSILLTDLSDGEDPVKAVPAGLAVVGVGLLENLSANRAVLTYLALITAGLWLVLRHRSLARAVLAMVPVLLAVGLSSVIVAAAGLTLSPLTTVSGPLVIATCTEFSVLILGRYLEERQRGLSPGEATDRASARTGRAFFTSALTTIFGFGVLVFSALPLLSDFGLIVTMNVAVALLSALVVMPPLLVWADERGLIGATAVSAQDAAHGVRLAATPRPGLLFGAVVLVVAGVALLVTADTEEGDASTSSFVAQALPTTTTTTTTTTTLPEGEEPDPIDVTQFGTEQPTGLIDGTLWLYLTQAGADPQRAVCTGSILLERFTQDDLIASGIAEFTDEALEPVVVAALDCGVDQATVDAAIAIARGG